MAPTAGREALPAAVRDVDIAAGVSRERTLGAGAAEHAVVASRMSADSPHLTRTCIPTSNRRRGARCRWGSDAAWNCRYSVITLRSEGALRDRHAGRIRTRYRALCPPPLATLASSSGRIAVEPHQLLQSNTFDPLFIVPRSAIAGFPTTWRRCPCASRRSRIGVPAATQAPPEASVIRTAIATVVASPCAPSVMRSVGISQSGKSLWSDDWEAMTPAARCGAPDGVELRALSHAANDRMAARATAGAGRPWITRVRARRAALGWVASGPRDAVANGHAGASVRRRVMTVGGDVR